MHQHERDRPDGTVAYRAALAAQLCVVMALASGAAPVLPAGSARLSRLLGVPSGRPIDATSLTVPATGTRLSLPAEPIFGG